MTPTKQTVCIATEETKKNGYNVPEGFIGKYGYFFTPEQLNEYTANVIKEDLETAAKTRKNGFYDSTEEEQLILNTFEKTYKKFKV